MTLAIALAYSEPQVRGFAFRGFASPRAKASVKPLCSLCEPLSFSHGGHGGHTEAQ